MGRAKEILDLLNLVDETTTIEAKSCCDKVDRSVMETICAFANEPGLGGGEIIIGVSENDDSQLCNDEYIIIGVTDSDKLQNEIATQCASVFNKPIRPLITTEFINGKKVIIISVEELEDNAKPLYFIKEGLPRGAFRRIGATDQRCTEDDLSMFYSSADSYEQAIISDSSLDDLDENAITRYRHLRSEVNPHAEELTYNDIDLLSALCACKKDKNGEYRLTHAGLIVFGKSMALRRIIPTVRVDYIRVQGTEWLQDVEKRFDTIDMRGPLILLVNRIYNAIVDDLPRGFILPDGEIQAKSAIGLPEKTLREAIVNSLIHRSYRTNSPIQVIRYSNRIEITNPGVSLKPEDSLGEPGSVLRNPFISSIFHETNLAETKGSGLGAMRKMMTSAKLAPPTFESNHAKNHFTIRLLLHHFLGEKDIEWLDSFSQYNLNSNQKIAIIFTREVGAIDNRTYRQLTAIKQVAAAKDLKGLCSNGILISKGHGRITYYIPGETLLEKIHKPTMAEGKPTMAEGKPTMAEGKPTMVEGKPTMVEGKPTMVEGKPTMVENLPKELSNRIKSLQKKVSRQDLCQIILDLCEWKPMTISEIALLIHRNESYLQQEIIRPLRQEKKLRFFIPEMAKHPKQKYVTIANPNKATS